MGQAKLRKIEIQQLKEKVEDTLLYTDGLFEICEILDLNQKKKWMIRYKNEYLGGLKNASDPQLYEKTVRFIKAKINGVDVGFIRINDKSHHFSENYEGNVWSVTDAFVEREFQRLGVLRKLIQYAVNELCVKMCFMEGVQSFV